MCEGGGVGRLEGLGERPKVQRSSFKKIDVRE